MNSKFSIGDKVIYTNEFGACWGIKKITDVRWEKLRSFTYQYEGSDTPWFYVDEKNFQLAEDSDFNLTSDELQEKYGFETTREQLMSLLEIDV